MHAAASAGTSQGLAKRVIACLDVRANDAGDLVVTKGDQYDVRDKGTAANDVRNLGLPVQLAGRYFVEGADEVTFLNITGFRDFPLGDLPMLEVSSVSTQKLVIIGLHKCELDVGAWEVLDCMHHRRGCMWLQVLTMASASSLLPACHDVSLLVDCKRLQGKPVRAESCLYSVTVSCRHNPVKSFARQAGTVASMCICSLAAVYHLDGRPLTVRALFACRETSQLQHP